MPDIWFVSDTHFNHANILSFKREDGTPVRSFDSVSHMNEVLIDRWNARVKPGDKVYHLGDVFFGSKDAFKRLWPRLNGKKRLIVGNHDDVKFLASGGFFQKIGLWRLFKAEGFLCTHLPLHEAHIRKARLNLHGHTHEKGSPPGPYLSCCVELTGYRPLHMDEVRAATP